MPDSNVKNLPAALDWQRHAGINELTVDQPIDRFTETPFRRTPPKSHGGPPTQHNVQPTRPRPADQSNVSAPPTQHTAQPASPHPVTTMPTRPTPQPTRPATAPQAASTAEGVRELAKSCGDLTALRTAIESFEGCPLKSGARNTVVADGNPAARVMIVGEAPGEQEDAQGLPFVGRSGQLLDEALSYIKLNRASDKPSDSVYITNIMPWRPPGNRNPTEDEIRLMLPFCEQHILLAKPELLLLLGNIANKSLLRVSEGITKLRGQWTLWLPVEGGEAIPTMPSFHPSYLLRTPIAKKMFWKDLRMVRRRLDEGPSGD